MPRTSALALALLGALALGACDDDEPTSPSTTAQLRVVHASPNAPNVDVLVDGTVEGLLADKAKLTSILTFHVVPGRVTAADIVRMGGATPKTVNGQTVAVTVRDGKVYVNGAQVVTADVGASNGVIHVIDAVLLPAAPSGY